MDDIAQTLETKLLTNHQYETSRNKYLALKTDEDRVKFMLHMLGENMQPLLPEPSMKSITASQNYRKEGNQIFVTPSSASQMDTSIELYTKSIVFAPPKSCELALGYANRSAALFKARLYQDCIQDISRALALPYPDDLKAKLYARRARCLMTLKRPTKEQKEELKEALKMAAEYLDKMAANDQSRKLIEKMLKEPEKMVPIEGEYRKWRGEALMPKVSDEKSEIKDVSSALKLKFTEEFGNHVVATRDISPGELLAVVKPYAGVLAREKCFTHCEYCMEKTWSSIPCEGCCEVVYCNEDCKNRAYDEYHDIECQVMRHLIALNMNHLGVLSCRLAVRAIKEARSIQALRDKIKEINNREDLRTTQARLNERGYASIYTLVRNTEKRSFDDLIIRSLSSSYILLALATNSNLFGKKFEGKWNELEADANVTFLGGLIMRHMQIIPCNSQTLYEEGFDMNSFERGVVLMPFSQMNHSCHLAITKVGYGTSMAFYANYGIKMGEQVFDNYGKCYRAIPRAERRMKLQEQFYFDCNCCACTENWPTSSTPAPSFELGLPYQTLKKLKNFLRNYPGYYQRAVSGNLTNVSVIIADINELIKVFQKMFGLSCDTLAEIVDTKKRILALKGNRFQTVNLN